MAYLNGKRIGINAHVICDTDASYIAGHNSGYAEGHALGYDEGQKSMAVAAAAKGNPAVLDYVHPIEHELGVTVSRRNLLDIGQCKAPTGQPWGLNIEKNDDVVHVYGTINDNSNGGYISMVVLLTAQTELEGKGYIIQSFNVDTGKAMTEQECNFRTYGLRTAGENAIAITIVDAPAGGEIDYRFRVGVSEEAQTTYAPYIADLSGVSVTRYGRNLFDLEWFEANLHNWKFVEFNGRRCITNVLNTDCILTGYATKYFPAAIKSFKVDMYCAESTTSVFTLRDNADTSKRFILPSNDINNWTVTTNITDGVAGYSLYANKPHHVYIDLDSIIATVEIDDDIPYEPYVTPQTATANADGAVEGIQSAPTADTLTVDNDGVTIHAEYWLDAASKIADMEAAILDLGGSL